ncbi:substrate-binding domain-containing protein [Saccharopolyspora aridisoli]|uniref:substrate-binding domain-containing protein n=1 Tax=Saccharopolyspora aridisoli TaxID=2530385 RepID=UPI00140445C0|nr:substrate-binding domain-containing protein [Saccharopolyspora aridisoli]
MWKVARWSVRSCADAASPGIACGSDLMALGVIRCAQRSEIDVPRDVPVVGFNDSTFMSMVHPPLTTARQPIGAVARTTVTLLLSQARDNAAYPDEIVFDPELVTRSSTNVARSAAQSAALRATPTSVLSRHGRSRPIRRAPPQERDLSR